MPYINVRGVEHYYEWIRKSSTEVKPVMVFIHGWGGSARYWKSTADALCDKFDCLLYDLRGFGRYGLSRCQGHRTGWDEPGQKRTTLYKIVTKNDDLGAFLGGY